MTVASYAIESEDMGHADAFKIITHGALPFVEGSSFRAMVGPIPGVESLGTVLLISFHDNESGGVLEEVIFPDMPNYVLESIELHPVQIGITDSSGRHLNFQIQQRVTLLADK